MSILNLKEILSLSYKEQLKIISSYNSIFLNLSSQDRIKWALNNLPSEFVLSSSFGIQSIVSLHLIIQQYPDIPVILIDTGYLFPETYTFIDDLTLRFNLNLKIFRSLLSPSWQESRYGKLWKKGIDGINFYNIINKVHPMCVALKKLSVGTWFAGLRKVQSKTRENLSFLSIQMNVFKFLPILDWDNKDIHDYIKKNNLHYHPLFKKGYSSLGDVHTTIRQSNNISEEKTRFFGLKRECGLHDF